MSRVITSYDLSGLATLTMVTDLPSKERRETEAKLGRAAKTIWRAYQGKRAPRWAEDGAARLRAIVLRMQALV